uniref:Zinc finger cchc domain-containing protein 2 n=1 Tax=Triatoma infestans TaxID=30076 RepID=A0A170XH18_TRIIF
MGKRDFHELRQSENEANSLSELNALDLQCLSNQQVRTKLAVYVSLLYSCNYTCSNSIFKILTKSDDIHSLLKTPGDDTILDDLLLIFTLAINHPAFSFEQKLSLEKIFSQLLEEDRLFLQSNGRNSKSFTATTMEPIHDKSPQLQGYSACIPLEDAHIIGVPSPSQLPMAQTAAHHPAAA